MWKEVTPQFILFSTKVKVKQPSSDSYHIFSHAFSVTKLYLQFKHQSNSSSAIHGKKSITVFRGGNKIIPLQCLFLYISLLDTCKEPNKKLSLIRIWPLLRI